MPETLTVLTEFLLELDALKTVERRTYIQAGMRKENSAEHSWHLALACWTIAEAFELKLNQEKLLKLALVHDLGEIDAGDTFLYASNRSSAHNAELACVKRLQAHPGNALAQMTALWQEQEDGYSAEAKLLKAVDRLLPFLHNIASQGKTWRGLGIRRSQVVQAHAFIADDFPTIHHWISMHIDQAVEQGWLGES